MMRAWPERDCCGDTWSRLDQCQVHSGSSRCRRCATGSRKAPIIGLPSKEITRELARKGLLSMFRESHATNSYWPRETQLLGHGSVKSLTNPVLGDLRQLGGTQYSSS